MTGMRRKAPFTLGKTYRLFIVPLAAVACHGTKVGTKTS